MNTFEFLYYMVTKILIIYFIFMLLNILIIYIFKRHSNFNSMNSEDKSEIIMASFFGTALIVIEFITFYFGKVKEKLIDIIEEYL